MNNNSHWKLNNQRYLFKSKWYNVRQDELTLPDGHDITYTMIEHPGYSLVVPIRSDGCILLEKVYRYTIGKYLLECPSGGLEGDTPESGARRELLEETGFESEKLYPLGSYYGSKGISNEYFHLFAATNIKDSGKINREPTEEIELIFLDFNKAVKMSFNGEIEDAPSAFAIILADQKIIKGLLKI